jgi:hypothetical protein
MLRAMFRWTRQFESGADKLEERLLPYRAKTTTLRSRKDGQSFLLRFAR